MTLKLCLAISASACLISTGCASQNVQTGDVSGNCNAIGNNNIVTCTWSRADFSEALGNSLIAQMPDMTKPVVLDTVGGTLDQQIGDKVQAFLAHKGYTVKERNIIGIYSPPPDRSFVLQVGGKEYHLQVAPSAH
jgi:hypothetical protein